MYSDGKGNQSSPLIREPTLFSLLHNNLNQFMIIILLCKLLDNYHHTSRFTEQYI